MTSIYKYRFDRRTLYWTLIYLVVFVLFGVWLYLLYEGGYLSAWFTSFVVALLALMALSIPRRIVVSDEKVEIRCLLDITEIARSEIASVRRVDARDITDIYEERLYVSCSDADRLVAELSPGAENR